MLWNGFGRLGMRLANGELSAWLELALLIAAFAVLFRLYRWWLAQ